jgi:hypothetical protein
VDKIRAIRWIALSLAILAIALVFIDIESGHIERSMSLIVIAIVVGAIGLALDFWARTSPTNTAPMTNAGRHPLLTRALFFGALLGLVIVAIQAAYSDTGLRISQRIWIPVFSVSMLVTYNLLLGFIRFMRIRFKNRVKTQEFHP